MSLITTKQAETLDQSQPEQVQAVLPVDEIPAGEADRFAQLINTPEQSQDETSADSPDDITLEELQQRFMETAFRAGFNRAMDKAKDIIKDMKD